MKLTPLIFAVLLVLIPWLITKIIDVGLENEIFLSLLMLMGLILVPVTLFLGLPKGNKKDK